MSLLIFKEFFVLAPVQAPYEVLPLHNMYLREEYHGVYIGDELIGWNRTVLENLEESGEGEDFELRHASYLSFRFLGHEREMLVQGESHLDGQLYLKDFHIKITSGDSKTEFDGYLGKNVLNMVIQQGANNPPVRRILPFTGKVFFSEALRMIWTPENLKVGKTGIVQLWNPLLFSFETVKFRVSGKEIIPHNSKDQVTFVIYVEKDGLETRMWATPEGIVIRQESPTGLLLVKEEAWKLFDTMREKRGSLPDLPNLYSLPSNVIIENPQSVTLLKITLKTGEKEEVLTFKRHDLDRFKDFTLPVMDVKNEEILSYLAATEFIQSNDPTISKQAAKIVGKEKNGLKVAIKLMKWVHNHVSPNPTVNIPSALQVLQSKKGDCNEYTALYTALARSMGLPTRMIGGVMYQDGRFFYHAWPEVFLGEWVPVDPTFNQAPADATHIPLVIGGMKEQVSLIGKIGQIRINILDYQTADIYQPKEANS